MRKRYIVFFSILLCCTAGRHSNKANTTERSLLAHIQADSSSYQSYLALADLYLQTGAFEAAIRYFDQALAHQAPPESVFLPKAMAHWRNGEKKQAAELFITVLSAKQPGLSTAAQIAREIGCPYSFKQITFAPGENAFPAAAKKSNEIAFQSNRDGNWEIYVMKQDGSSPKRLTQNPARDENPTISADAGLICFTSTRDDSTHKYVEQTIRHLYVYNSNEKSTKKLCGDEAACWSPWFAGDSMDIFYITDQDYLTQNPAGRESNIYEWDMQNQVSRRMTFQLSGKMNLGDYDQMRKELIFSCNQSGKYELFQARSGKMPKPFKLELPGDKTGLKMDSQGKRGILVRSNDKMMNLFLMETATRSMQQITCFPGITAGAVFAADDQHIIFHSNRSREYQIYSIDLLKPIAIGDLMAVLQEI